MKIFIEAIRSNFKESKAKENHSARDKKYSQRKLFECSESDKQNCFQKNLKFIDVSRANIAMKEILININLNSRTVKYKKTKLIKFNSVEVVKITKRL